jgi:hypothetical protein
MSLQKDRPLQKEIKQDLVQQDFDVIFIESKKIQLLNQVNQKSLGNVCQVLLLKSSLNQI